jgi:hypothetical protein
MAPRRPILEVLSLAGYFALLIGVMGQGAFLGPVLKQTIPSWLKATLITFPWLIVFTLTYCKQYFLPARILRFSLLFAMSWFALLAILAESLLALGQLPAESAAYALTPARCAMHFGWLSFFSLSRLYADLGKLQSAASA